MLGWDCVRALFISTPLPFWTKKKASSYIIRDTLEPWQLEAQALDRQLNKEARKGNGSPRKGNRWTSKGNGPPRKGNRRPFWLSSMSLIVTVPLTPLIGGAHAELLRNGQNIGPNSRKRYSTNSETFSTCSQHANFTFTHFPGFQACVFYMGSYCPHAWVNDAHACAKQRIRNTFLHVDNMYYLHLLIWENIVHIYFSSTMVIGRCPSTVRPVFAFQLSKQQNRTRTTSSTVLETSPNRTRTKKCPLEELEAVCFLSRVLNWESTENWDFHRLEPYTKPYSDTVRGKLGF